MAASALVPICVCVTTAGKEVTAAPLYAALLVKTVVAAQPLIPVSALMVGVEIAV
jgi:hypothetical protein